MKAFLLPVFLFASGIVLAFGANEETYSNAEKAALAQFRPLVQNMLKKDYEKKDIYLIHWLRARDLDVQRAKEMLVNNLKWRKENSMDTIEQESDMKRLLRRYPTSIGDSTDKFGRPALLTIFSKWDIRKGKLSNHNFKRLVVYIFEAITKNAFKKGKSQFFFLADMNQYNLRQHACLACVTFYTDLVNQYEKYYPNMAVKTYLINTPKSFEGILSIIRQLMSPHTKKNMEIFGLDKREWQAKLLTFFDASELPRTYGGTKSS